MRACVRWSSSGSSRSRSNSTSTSSSSVHSLRLVAALPFFCALMVNFGIFNKLVF